MGTRSRIGYVNTDGKIVSSYCHWDGYPSHNGKILLENYNTIDKVKELVDGGDMSSLGPRCDKPEGHSYESPHEGCTIYYNRDRCEDDVGPETCESVAGFIVLATSCDGEFVYLFEKDKWKYADVSSESNFKLKRLTKTACKK